MRNLRAGCLKTEGKPIFCHSLAEFGATFWADGITDHGQKDGQMWKLKYIVF